MQCVNGIHSDTQQCRQYASGCSIPIEPKVVAQFSHLVSFSLSIRDAYWTADTMVREEIRSRPIEWMLSMLSGILMAQI